MSFLTGSGEESALVGTVVSTTLIGSDVLMFAIIVSSSTRLRSASNGVKRINRRSV